MIGCTPDFTIAPYALTNTRLNIDHTLHTDINFTCPPYELVNDTMITPGIAWDNGYQSSGTLTVYHNGIKDYTMLFPHIKHKALKRRLARFALEAHNAFGSQSWMSYCFMVSGVIEGLLYYKFHCQHFVELLELAKYDNIISNEEASLLYNAHQCCHKIQAYKCRETIPDRKQAIELSALYDRLLKNKWVSQDSSNEKRITTLIRKTKNIGPGNNIFTIL